MIRFYVPDIESTAEMSEVESGHCVRVLRMNTGDEVEVVDGSGSLYRCRIALAHPKHTELTVLEKTPLPKVWTPQISIAIGPTKHLDRMEWLVEKLVEIGVDRIIPLRCRYSERKELKTERLEKIAVSAMKQSLKAVLPRIDAMTPIDEFLCEVRESDMLKYMGYCDENTPRRLLAADYTPGKDVCIMIGPEGDFSPEEVTKAIGAGFVPVTMGDNRLRTETAALVACDTIHIINQRFS